MTEDRRRPAQYTSVRDDRLRRWLGTTVRSYSSALGTLPPVDIDALGDGRSFVLEPGETGFGRSAPIVDEGHGSTTYSQMVLGCRNAGIALLACSPEQAVDVGDDPVPLPGLGLSAAEWWTPPAARASWVRCPGGTGFHTWPEDELIEVVDGELHWSAVGWHGSVWLRVGTGIAAVVDESPCPTCGRTTPRVEPRGRFR